MSRELLFSVTKKDLTIQTFRSGGSGGQHQNTTDSGVRLIHKESGAVGESREHKSQHHNKRAALKRLTEHPKLKMFIAEKMRGCSIEESVEKEMAPENLKIETRGEDGKWQSLS